MSAFVELEHPRFRRAQRDIFIKRVVSDCMNHECKLVKEDGRKKLDACCQYGVDVDLSERDGIMKHAEQIRSLMNDHVKDRPWFKDEVKDDADFPSGKYVRTQTAQYAYGEGCIFLSHDLRGCAIHRASIEAGWDFHGIKPHVCRLFPLSYDSEAIVISDDYLDYSCAYDDDAPTLYQGYRGDLAAIFGDDLVRAMDEAEAKVSRGSLPVAL